MEFDNNRPIYLQIAGWINDKILRGEWPAGERIPSVRELGAALQVNPNTVMRAYEKLQAQQVVSIQRGIGYFIAADAVRIVRDAQRESFVGDELPLLFGRMELLGMEMREVESLYESYRLKKNGDENKQ